MSIVAPSLRGRVSRRDVALSPHVWFAVWATFGLFAFSTLIITFVMPDISQARMVFLTAVLTTIAIVLSRLRAPEPGSPAIQVVLSLAYIGPALTIWAFAPHGSGAVVSATFVAPLASIWLINRRQIAAHLVAASVVVFIPSMLGQVDTATLFACISLVPAMWVLAICCVLVMESAETQGRDLERLVGIDPLTGLGNRRSFDDQLTNELTRHSASHRPLTLLSLDLNGFGRLNDTLGHTAGDEVLELVATTLTGAARRHDIVIRQGGDEFCVLLPNTDAKKAQVRMRVLREHLSQIAGFGSGISTGIGAATYPADGETVQALLNAADDRLRADKLREADRLPSPVSLAAEFASRPDTPDDRPRAAAPPSTTPFDDHVSRHDLSLNRSVWHLTGSMIVIFSLVGVALRTWAPELTGPGFPYSVAFGASVGIFFLITPPPAIDSLRSHACIAATYVIPVTALATSQPGGSVAIGSAIFVGCLTSMRAIDRRVIAAHLVTAQALFLSLVALGLVDAITTIGILLLIVTMWVLAVCCTLVFEAIEAQGSELVELARRDPLTGAGNRLLLHEQLGREVPLHAASGRPMTILSIDLDGFNAVNDTLGHAVGDDLLITVASRLRSASGPGATVVRQGGDEFCVILPDTSSAQATITIEAIRTAIGSIQIAGASVTAGIGAATYPFDGSDTVALLERADADLLHDRYGVLELASPLRA